MRRLMHVLIVALLCGSLGVDTAKACWLLRNHGRSRRCQPNRCEPVAETCCRPPVEVVAPCHACENVAVTSLASEAMPVEHAVTESVATAAGSAITPAAPLTPQAPVAAVGTEPVVHGPTTVVGTPTPSPDPVSVVAAPTAEPTTQPTTPKASPMPLETAVDQPAAPQDEPLPRLKPAVTADVAPASAEQPAAEPPTPPAAPAPVDGLAAAPAVAPTPVPREPNLFDLYEDTEDEAEADEDEDEDMEPGESEDSEEMDADTEIEPGAEPNGEPGDEPDEEMQEAENAAPAETDDDSDEEMAEDAADTDAAPADESSDAPDADPADEPVPAGESAAVSVSGEPLRRWTDATGGRDARGWLVSLSPDSDGRRVRILKTNGRHATVAVDSLSRADQAYVSDVASRLAKASPGAADTAGL